MVAMRNDPAVAAVVCLAGAICLAAASTASAEVFIYDWSTANASAAGVVLDNESIGGDNNDNWVNLAGSGNGDSDVVRNTAQPSFFTGNYYQSTGVSADDDLYERANDANFSYSIPANARSVTMSYLLDNYEGGGAHRVGLRKIGVAAAINFGIFGEWGVREPDGTVITGSANGAADLDATRRTYRATLTLDLTPVGSTKLVDMVVENLTDGGSETIFSGLSFDLGTLTDPSQWDGLYLRISNNDYAGTSTDDIRISYSAVPEPSGLVLLSGLGAVGLAAYGRRRKGTRAA